MNTNIDFKDLWQQQKAVIPDVTSLYVLVDKTKGRMFWKVVFTNIALIITSVFIISIWIYYQPNLISTKVGISIVIFAMMLFLFVYNKLIPYLKQTRNDASLSEYLLTVKQIQVKQQFIQSIMMPIYFILLFVGLCMYMYEYVPKSLLGFGIYYGITTAWIAFNWFYILPKTKHKQRLKTEEIISQLEKIQKQLED